MMFTFFRRCSSFAEYEFEDEETGILHYGVYDIDSEDISNDDIKNNIIENYNMEKEDS